MRHAECSVKQILQLLTALPQDRPEEGGGAHGPLVKGRQSCKLLMMHLLLVDVVSIIQDCSNENKKNATYKKDENTYNSHKLQIILPAFIFI